MQLAYAKEAVGLLACRLLLDEWTRWECRMRVPMKMMTRLDQGELILAALLFALWPLSAVNADSPDAHAEQAVALEKEIQQTVSEMIPSCRGFGDHAQCENERARARKTIVDIYTAKITGLLNNKESPCYRRANLWASKKCSDLIEIKFKQAFNALYEPYPRNEHPKGPDFVFNRGARPEKYRICFVGDTGDGRGGQAKVAELLGSRDGEGKPVCDEIRHLGDLIYYVGLQDKVGGKEPGLLERNFYRYFRTLQPDMYIVLGNHDYFLNPDIWMEISRDSPQQAKSPTRPDPPHKYEFPNPYYLDVLAGPGEKGLCLLSLDTTPFCTPNEAQPRDTCKKPAALATAETAKNQSEACQEKERADFERTLDMDDRSTAEELQKAKNKEKKDKGPKDNVVEEVIRRTLLSMALLPVWSKRAQEQISWLERLYDQGVFKKRCTHLISLSHHPFHNISKDRDESLSAFLVQGLFRELLFDKLKIKMIVAGHDHFLGWIPQVRECHGTLQKTDHGLQCTSNKPLEVAEIISGSGGQLNTNADVDGCLPPNHRVWRRHGFVQMELQGRSQAPDLTAQITFFPVEQNQTTCDYQLAAPTPSQRVMWSFPEKAEIK